MSAMLASHAMPMTTIPRLDKTKIELIRVLMPSRRAGGSMTSTETDLLINLLGIRNARKMK